jgi:hypothetical protein
MRKFILIAAMVLASAAAAQAGESRSLSRLNPADPAATSTEPRANDVLRADNVTNTTPATDETPRYAPPPAETQAPADTTRNTTETPHYSTRPTPVRATPPATTTTDTPPSNEPTYHRSGRNRQAQMYHRPHHHGRITAGRIIAALHRYGIYW